MEYEDHLPSPEAFIAELREAWEMAGRPSYTQIVKRSKKLHISTSTSGMRVEILARSTAQGILAGRRVKPPRWPWVASLWAVLRDLAEESGLDPSRLGTLTEWKAKYDAVMATHDAQQRADASASGESPAWPPVTGRAFRRSRMSSQPPRAIANETDFRADPVLNMLWRFVGTRWWDSYGDAIPGWFKPYLSLEPAAVQIRTYDMGVPGVLQTWEYASEAVRLTPHEPTPAAASHLAELRMRRQQLLVRPDGPRQWVIIDEMALHRQLGGPRIMRAQIRRLIDLADHPNITIQILPLNSSIHSASAGPITLLRFREYNSPDIVYLEHHSSAYYLHDPDETGRYRKVLSRLATEALKPEASTVFLYQILREA
jgi:Domain of unknown function (DUF5753)